jgi:hypothetical protein
MTTKKARTGGSRARTAKSGDGERPTRDHLPADELAEGTARMEDAAVENQVSPPPRVADPGMSDASIQRGTGKSWDAWFSILDDWGAATRSHKEIAAHLIEAHQVGGWWAQGLTVGYERARGRRAVHERSDGFSVNVSKTFPVSVERLYAAFADEVTRDRWVEPGTLRPRSTREHRTAHFDIGADGVRLGAFFTAKAADKSHVVLEIERLGSAVDVEPARAQWKERVAALAAVLNAPG